MKAYIWTLIALMLIEIVGKAWLLHERRLERKPGVMLTDIAICAGFVVWGAFLLGTENK